MFRGGSVLRGLKKGMGRLQIMASASTLWNQASAGELVGDLCGVDVDGLVF